MRYLRIISLATSVGMCGFLYEYFRDKHKQNIKLVTHGHFPKKNPNGASNLIVAKSNLLGHAISLFKVRACDQKRGKKRDNTCEGSVAFHNFDDKKLDENSDGLVEFYNLDAENSDGFVEFHNLDAENLQLDENSNGFVQFHNLGAENLQLDENSDGFVEFYNLDAENSDGFVAFHNLDAENLQLEENSDGFVAFHNLDAENLQLDENSDGFVQFHNLDAEKSVGFVEFHNVDAENLQLDENSDGFIEFHNVDAENLQLDENSDGFVEFQNYDAAEDSGYIPPKSEPEDEEYLDSPREHYVDDDEEEEKEIEIYPVVCDKNIPLRRFQDASEEGQFIIEYVDFGVCYIGESRLPLWTFERVSCENVEEIRHRHWELINIEPKVPDKFQCCFDYCTNNEFDVVRIGDKDLYPPKCQGEFSCEFCEYSRFWGVFFDYVKFLTYKYDKVYIWSSVLYELETDECGEPIQLECGDVPIPSHFLKVIFCDNGDGTCRLECYKIRNEPNQTEYLELMDYYSNREELEQITGFKIFDPVPKKAIKQKTRHPCFVP